MAEPQAQPAAPAATTPAAPAAPADTTPAAPALAATDTQAQPAAPAAPAEPATAAPAASTNVGLTAARQPITPTQLRPATPASKFEAALKTGPNFDEFCALLASKFSVTSAPSTLLAALSEIASTDAQDVASLGQWAGEMWAGKGYERKYVPLLTQRTLTSLKVKGWEFDVVPEVGDYAGIGNEPASQAVAASETSATAARLAGGWALDRSYADFSTPEFWAAFWRQAAKSYAKKSDAKVTPALVAATGAATDLGAAPSGVATAAHLIVEGAMSIIDDADPSFALVATPLYKELLKTRADDSLAYIRMALGIKDGDTMGVQIVPDASLNDNEVLVGDKNAAAFYELPGVPVRVDTASIANGSVEHGLFGYYLIDVENTAGLALVSDTEPE